MKHFGVHPHFLVQKWEFGALGLELPLNMPASEKAGRAESALVPWSSHAPFPQPLCTDRFLVAFGIKVRVDQFDHRNAEVQVRRRRWGMVQIPPGAREHGRPYRSLDGLHHPEGED